jgi:acyl transferase domain-containing protein
VFAARLRRCADAIETYVDSSVEDVLRQRSGAPSLERVEVVQPVLFSVRVALAELWMSSGLAPQAVIGQSQGEIAAACVAGALSLEDAVHVIVARSQLFAEELVGRGGIASIGLPEREVSGYLTQHGGRLEVAGIIGGHSVTVAGDLGALKSLVTQLNQLGIAARMVRASTVSPSPTQWFATSCPPACCCCPQPLKAQWFYRAIQDAAAGYLSKEADREVVSSFTAQVRQHAQGQASVLSDRERQILQLIADGKSVPDMAAELYLAQSTIKTHIRRLYEKLGVSDRGAAVAQAMRNHMLE